MSSALCLALALMLAPASPPDTDAASPAEIRVAWVGAPEQLVEARALESRLFAGWDTEVEFGEHSGLTLEALFAPTESRALVFIDLSDAEDLRLFIVDPQTERVFIRTLESSGELDAVALDELAHVLEPALEVLLEGGAIGISRGEAAESLPSPPPAEPADPPPAKPPAEEVESPTVSEPLASEIRKEGPEAPSTGAIAVGASPEDAGRSRALELRLDLGYGVSVLGPTALHGPALGLRALVAHSDRVAIGATLVARYFPLTPAVDDGALELRLTGGGLGLGAQTDITLTPAWSLEFELGTSFNLLSTRPVALIPSAVAYAPQQLPSWLASARMGPSWRWGRGSNQLVVNLSASVDIALNSQRFGSANVDGELLDPWLLRPGAWLSLGWARQLD